MRQHILCMKNYDFMFLYWTMLNINWVLKIKYFILFTKRNFPRIINCQNIVKTSFSLNFYSRYITVEALSFCVLKNIVVSKSLIVSFFFYDQNQRKNNKTIMSHFFVCYCYISDISQTQIYILKPIEYSWCIRGS